MAFTSKRPEMILFNLKLSGCASVVPKKLVPSVNPLLPNVLQPPADPILAQLAFVPLVIRNFPALLVCDATNALNPSFAVVAPVPPLVIPIAVAFHVPVAIVPNVVIELCPA